MHKRVVRLEGMLNLRADIRAQRGPQHVEEPDEHRDLGDQGQARGERVDLVLLVELHDLLLLALLVFLVLVLDLLQLRRHPLKLLHRVKLLHCQRKQQRAHRDRQQDDRPAPRHPDAVVEELQHRLEHVDQRLEDVGGDQEHDQPMGAGARGLNRRCSSTGSKPPWLKGLHRNSRHPARTSPRSMPNRSIACTAYSEHDG